MVANDGLDGYSKISSMIKEGNVDAIKFIITVIQMPNLDGFGFTKLLKSNISTRNIPVLGYTASPLEGIMPRARSVGIIHVLQKETFIIKNIEKLKSLSFL